MQNLLILCGPTGSGKTSLAHTLALKYNGSIINADSAQLYRDFPVITASPSNNLYRDVQYHLYNFTNIDESMSMHKYAILASEILSKIYHHSKIPIIVGGSGLYINALINGYHKLPDIPEYIYKELNKNREKIGHEKFFQNLLNIDPLSAKYLNYNDTYRVIRAYAIIKFTGRSFFDFLSEEKIKLLKNINIKIILLNPERNFLYKSCNKRLNEIIDSGEAIKEVYEAVKKYGEDKISQINIIPIQEIIDFIHKKIDLNELINSSSRKIRRYAKRQITWFKHQINPNLVLSYSTNEEFEKQIHNSAIEELMSKYFID